MRLVRERLSQAKDLETVQRNIEEVNEQINRAEQKRDETQGELTSLNSRLEVQLKDFYIYFPSDYHEQHKKLFELSRKFLNQEALRNKENVRCSLALYSDFISGDYRAKQRMPEALDEHLKALSLLFPVITCTLLSVRNMLPLSEGCVDRIIVDEAGMILLHQTFPLLVRARTAIVVGDPLQIPPIINQGKPTLQEYHQKAFLDRGLTESDICLYSPDEIDRATTYHRAAGASGEDGDQGQGILLIEHYRCQPSIIASQRAFYFSWQPLQTRESWRLYPSTC